MLKFTVKPQLESVRLVLARWILGVITHKQTQLFPPCWDLSWRPIDAFAAVLLRFMTPHCLRKSYFYSLFPMITTHIYQTVWAGGVCVLECVCLDGRMSSPGDKRNILEANKVWVESLETHSHSIAFICFYYFLDCRLLLKWCHNNEIIHMYCSKQTGDAKYVLKVAKVCLEVSFAHYRQ